MRRTLWASALAALTLALTLTGCVTTTIPVDGGSEPPTSTAPATAEAPPVDVSVCEQFFSTPNYEASLFYQVLSVTGDDVVTTVDQDVERAVADLADQGAETRDPLATIAAAAGGTATVEKLAGAVDDLGVACGDLGVTAAAYATGHGEDGGKPDIMTCNDMLSKPQTIDVFGNSNVLPSNAFKLVGMSGSWVNDPEKAARVADQIQREIDATEDDHLRGLLEDFREPFLGQGSGVKAPLDALTTYCDEEIR